MNLKRHSYLFIMFFLCIAAKCDKTKPGFKSCPDLPNIQFKNSQIGSDKETTFRLITELVAAAKTDAATSKAISASGSANIKSELGRKLKENITASQSVSDEFWEQNITFSQLVCITEAQTKRKDLSKEDRKRYSDLLIQVLSDRNEYLNQQSLKKKS